MQLLKKMGGKQILGNPKKIYEDHLSDKENGAVIEAYTMFGRAEGFDSGTTNIGPWIVFLGDFECTNHITGERMRSGKAFVPEPLCSMLFAAMKDAEKIEFACTVSMKKSDTALLNYEWVVEPHTEIKASDSLSHLRSLALNPPTPKKEGSKKSPK